MEQIGLAVILNWPKTRHSHVSLPKSPIVTAHCGVVLNHTRAFPDLFPTKISSNKMALSKEKV